jgi:uncharacterized membrane protein YdjX (TVP38/TMEM64 family)
MKKYLPFVWFSLMPIASALLISIFVLKLDLNFEWNLHTIACLFATAFILMGLAIVPTTFMSLLFGYLFSWKSFGLLVLAYFVASIIGYFIGNQTNREYWLALIRSFKKGESILTKIHKKESVLVFSCRLSPVLPFGLTNILFGVLSLSVKKVLIFGTLGMLPRTILFFWLGTQASSLSEAIQSKNDFPYYQFIIVALLFLSTFMIFRIFKSKEF